MLKNPNFPGIFSGPHWRSLQHSSRPPSWWGEGLTESQGLTHYRFGNCTNDRFQMSAYMEFVFFFGFGERIKWTQQ